ncbi:MAG TPA: hypothetical protein VKH18_02595, partial [Terriglobales bacterium]|nr:hypothetical protein [Terriglobales bacterium]
MRIESFTDTNASSSAIATQIAADPIPPCKIGGVADGRNEDKDKDQDVENRAVVDALPNCAMATIPATRTRVTARPATTKPGKARFQGNGMGGGAAASRRTASMTETA